MKISIEKSSYIIFTKGTNQKLEFKLNLFGNKLPYSKEVKFLGINFDERDTFRKQIDEIREKCNTRLNIIKILSGKKWGLSQQTLGSLYKSLIGSILDYSFPCVNLFSETNLDRLQVVQNTAVRSILKLRFDTPSERLHYEAFENLKLHIVANRLSDLMDNYVRKGLKRTVPIVVRLASEYRKGFLARDVDYPIPLCNC